MKPKKKQFSTQDRIELAIRRVGSYNHEIKILKAKISQLETDVAKLEQKRLEEEKVISGTP